MSSDGGAKNHGNLSVHLTPAGTLRFLLSAWLVIMGLNALAVAGMAADLGQHRIGEWLIQWTYVGWEGNLPTLFSTLLMLSCSLMCAHIAALLAASGQAFRLQWRFLAALLLFLAIDESIQLHERFGNPTKAMFGEADGWLNHAWVLPYGLMLIGLAAAYWRFLLALPRATAVGLILAAGTFLTGAVGLEIIGGKLIWNASDHSLPIWVLTSFEEGFELAGFVIAAYVLMRHIARTWPDASIRITSR